MDLLYFNPPVALLHCFPYHLGVITWRDDEFVAVLNVSVLKGYFVRILFNRILALVK